MIFLHLEFLSQLQSEKPSSYFFCFFSETKNIGSEVTVTQDKGKFSMWELLLICSSSSICCPLRDAAAARQNSYTILALNSFSCGVTLDSLTLISQTRNSFHSTNLTVLQRLRRKKIKAFPKLKCQTKHNWW